MRGVVEGRRGRPACRLRQGPGGLFLACNPVCQAGPRRTAQQTGRTQAATLPGAPPKRTCDLARGQQQRGGQQRGAQLAQARLAGGVVDQGQGGAGGGGQAGWVAEIGTQPLKQQLEDANGCRRGGGGGEQGGALAAEEDAEGGGCREHTV